MQQKNNLLGVGLGFVIVFIIGFYSWVGYSMTNPNAGYVTTSTPTYILTPEAFYQEFQDNKIAAEKKYTGKTIQLTGEINSIDKNWLTGEAEIKISAGFFSRVECDFSKNYTENNNAITNIRQGQTITITGAYSGDLFGPALANCVIH